MIILLKIKQLEWWGTLVVKKEKFSNLIQARNFHYLIFPCAICQMGGTAKKEKHLLFSDW